ncbi:MAG: mannose-1-phosphate guanylyltransferase [Spirochaetales bacterium]|nr:mannose-1-phosphate guanylyltransferase [Spirochaetales bacterium]
MKPYVLIMAGGKGERFWPRSTKAFPKQLHKIYSNKTLLQETIDRALTFTEASRIYIGCSPELKDAIRKTHDVPAGQFVLEPVGRNTAPIIALAALFFAELDKDSMMVVLSADHFIQTHAEFASTIQAAMELALKDRLVTIGVRPVRPETGYGYIKKGEPLSPGFAIEAFVEKPDRERATAYLADGNYYWNSGIFIWKTARILSEFDEHAASISAPLRAHFPEIDPVFPELPSLPVDISIMEKSKRVAMVEARFVWDDVGSWRALRRVAPADSEKNVSVGLTRVVALSATENTVVSDRRLVALLGTRGLVIVDSGETLFVAAEEHLDSIKDLLGRLRENPSLQDCL